MSVSKEQILAVLNRQDNVGMHAVGRALVHLLNRQTYDEQLEERTKNHNGHGFTPADGKIGANMAKFYLNRGYLTTKQVKYWQKENKTGNTRLGKYWRQLKEEAELKIIKENLPHTVEAKFDNDATQVRQSHAYMRYRVWCSNNAGTEKEDWFIILSNQLGMNHSLTIHFRDPEIKLLFELAMV